MCRNVRMHGGEVCGVKNGTENTSSFCPLFEDKDIPKGLDVGLQALILLQLRVDQERVSRVLEEMQEEVVRLKVERCVALPHLRHNTDRERFAGLERRLERRLQQLVERRCVVQTLIHGVQLRRSMVQIFLSKSYDTKRALSQRGRHNTTQHNIPAGFYATA